MSQAEGNVISNVIRVCAVEAETNLSAMLLFWIAWRIVQHSSAIIIHNASALIPDLSQHGDRRAVSQDMGNKVTVSSFIIEFMICQLI